MNNKTIAFLSILFIIFYIYIIMQPNNPPKYKIIFKNKPNKIKKHLVEKSTDMTDADKTNSIDFISVMDKTNEINKINPIEKVNTYVNLKTYGSINSIDPIDPNDYYSEQYKILKNNL